MLRYRPGVALLIVDVQNDFADPKGSLAVRGAADVIPVINGEAALARSSGALVVLTQDWHPPRTPHFVRDGGPWPPHCVVDTWGAELHPALDVPQGTAIVRKGSNGEDGYSAFTMRDPATGEDVPTMLEPLLLAAGVEEVVIVGLATDYCVRATTLDAIRLGFRTTVLTDAIAAVDVRPRATAIGPSRSWRRPAPCSTRAGCADRDARRVLALGCLAAVAPRTPCSWTASSPRRGGRPPEPLRMLVVVDAPIDRPWRVLADIRLQPALDARDEGGPAHHRRARPASGPAARPPSASSASP